jgi:hypothetical protein
MVEILRIFLRMRLLDVLFFWCFVLLSVVGLVAWRFIQAGVSISLSKAVIGHGFPPALSEKWHW